jgi:hypothetical protein
MAVLVEAISIIIQRKTIDEKYPGGWDAFVENAPNGTLCADENVARLGFMSPFDVESFIKGLEKIGFRYIVDGQALEVAVIDQIRGFMTPCDWLDAGHVEIDGGKHEVTACKLKGCLSKCIISPIGWEYNKSLSREYGFIPSEHLDKSLKYLRHENGMDVYYNKLTNGEVYIGRSK